MQPVQDLTVDDRVSRTEFQYGMEDVDPNELALWTTRMMAKLQSLPELTDVAGARNFAGHLASPSSEASSSARC